MNGHSMDQIWPPHSGTSGYNLAEPGLQWIPSTAVQFYAILLYPLVQGLFPGGGMAGASLHPSNPRYWNGP